MRTAPATGQRDREDGDDRRGLRARRLTCASRYVFAVLQNGQPVSRLVGADRAGPLRALLASQ